MWRGAGVSRNHSDCKRLRWEDSTFLWVFFWLQLVLQVENSQLRSDLERLRQAVAGGGDDENNAVRELTGKRMMVGGGRMMVGGRRR